MKNKILPIVLLVIFLVSLFPAALAQNEGNQNKPTVTTSNDTSDTAAERPRLNQIRTQENIRAQVKDAIQARETNKIRTINKAVVQKYIQSKNQFIEARQLQQQARTKFTNAKLKIKECEGSETTECNQVRQNVRTGSKNFLENSADVIIRHLEKIKNQIQANERLSEDEVAELVAEIDAKITEVEEAKTTAETAETKQEIIESAKKINSAWKPIRNRALYWTGRLINAKMGGIVVKMEHLEERLMKTLDKMEAKGKDVSGIDPLLDEFHALLTSAKDHFDEAQESYKQFKETGDKTYLDEGKTHMDEARKDLVEAHEKLKEIVRAIKSTDGSEELEEATEETPIEEEEEPEEEETEEEE